MVGSAGMEKCGRRQHPSASDTGGSAVSVTVHPGRLRLEMTRRGWAAVDLARESRLSEATISAALAGKSIAASSLGLIAHALSKTPAIEVIDSLMLNDVASADLD
jgi:lambda repressor-like predicted transcriptional regulator